MCKSIRVPMQLVGTLLKSWLVIILHLTLSLFSITYIDNKTDNLVATTHKFHENFFSKGKTMLYIFNFLCLFRNGYYDENIVLWLIVNARNIIIW